VSWFDEAGLGLFIHWDHASQQGLEVSWPLVGGVFALPVAGDVGVEQYHSSAATFDPASWDPAELASMARAAGCRYGVFTTKHHSGYAMFDTAWSDFGVMQSPCGRDLVRSYVEAFRAEGLRVGLYFSLSDWSCPHYPAFTEAMKPYVFGASPPMPSDAEWSAYLDVLFGQVRELLTNYGSIDLMWFDGGWERPAAAWRGSDLAELMRSLQPGIIWNDRLPGVPGYATPEQFVPPQPLPGRWETCLTMNRSWGYVPGDRAYKSERELVHALCEAAGRGGNLLLNVSPTGSGALPAEQVSRLSALGSWVAGRGEAVHGVAAGLEPWQFYGPSTRRGSSVYLFCLMRPYQSVVVRGVPTARVAGVRLVGGDGRALTWRPRTSILDGLTEDRVGEVRIDVPPDAVDDFATVIRLDFEP
jgi:alpha-L-fucosidase